MPKLKTRKSAAKRFKRTKTGKFMRNKAFRRHLLTLKASKRRRSLRGATQLSPADASRVRKMLPNA